MNSMYEVIMELPLFQGMSYDKVSELIEKTKFNFLKYNQGDTIINQGDNCNYVRFVVSGTIVLEYTSQQERLSISEELSAPNVIGIDYLFGRETIYPFSVKAVTDCGILQIEKSEYINIIHNDRVFLFNLLNILSRNCQKSVSSVLKMTSNSVSERLALIVATLTGHKSKNIVLRFQQKNICQLFGVQRASLMNALDELKGLGIIDYSATEISVIDRTRMLEMLHSEER